MGQRRITYSITTHKWVPAKHSGRRAFIRGKFLLGLREKIAARLSVQALSAILGPTISGTAPIALAGASAFLIATVAAGVLYLSTHSDIQAEARIPSRPAGQATAGEAKSPLNSEVKGNGEVKRNGEVKAPVAAQSSSLADVEHATYRKSYTRQIRIGRGDNLMTLLVGEGVPRREAYAAIQVLGKIFDPRKLRSGQSLELTFGIVEMVPERFVGFRFDLKNGARTVTVARRGKGPFSAQEVKKKLTPQLVRGNAVIESSLYVAGLRAGVPPAVMIQLIQIYSFDVDFQREIRKGDKLEVMFNNYYDDKGKLVRQGDVLYASLTLRGVQIPLFRYTPSNGNVDYFNRKGESVRKALMRTPIDGARLSSGFGRRRHPVLGYTRLHTGSDFAAPRGTPIYAAGHGTLTMRGWNGGYGNYIRIRHNSSYQTAYAHMSRLAPGFRVGSRVRQGQIIGYVGTSGRSTGPHLHYEVHYKDRPINPMRLKLPTGQKLKEKDLEAFLSRRAIFDRMYRQLARDVKLASAPKTRAKSRNGRATDDGT